MDLEDDMPSEPMENSLWKGYFRQKLLIEVLRSLDNSEGRVWTAYPQGDKFDLFGYTGDRDSPQNKIAIEVRFRSSIPADELRRKGIYINKNKIKHIENAYKYNEVDKCILMAILSNVGVFSSELPADMSKLRESTKTRPAYMNNSGKGTESIVYVTGFTKVCSWEYYMQIATKYATELLKIQECEPTIKEFYVQERER